MTAAGAVSALAFQENDQTVRRKGRLKQSVTNGVFPRGRSLDENARDAARLGAKGYDLIGPKDWPTLKKYGLVPAMVPGFGGTIPDALNRKENHDALEKSMHEGIDLCAQAGAPNLITFSGNRRGMSDPEGADNCVLFLNKLKSRLFIPSARMSGSVRGALPYVNCAGWLNTLVLNH